jgi:hypothetical protein
MLQAWAMDFFHLCFDIIFSCSPPRK